MQLHQMRYVLEAADKKSFSSAAKALFLSQPSLSQQILQLEKELGVPLFVRHSKSVSLTEAGEQFVLSARRILNEIDQLTEDIKKYGLLQSGTLRVGMLWIAGYLQLPRIVTDYHKKYPLIDYQIHVEGSKTLFHMLDSRAISAAFVTLSPHAVKQEEYYYHKIMDDSYVAVVSSAHPLSQKPVLRISELDGENIVMPARGSTFWQDIQRVFFDHQATPRVLCETSQSDVVMQLISQNLAIGFASRSIAEKLLPPQCRIIPLEVQLPRPIYYVTLNELLEYPTVRSFTDFVCSYSAWED